MKRASPRAPVTAALPRVPLAGIAALFLERQHLGRPRARRLTPARLSRFAADVGGIQLDTINVVERAHLLTLWSRFGPYDRRRLDRMVYRERRLFEFWAHAACLVPIGDLPMWRRVMLDYRRSPRHRAWHTWVRTNRALVADVEGAIRERGPLASSDFEEARPGRRGGWWNRKPATHALDFLWMSGRTAVDSRVNFQKRYDLIERVLPGCGEDSAPAEDEFLRWHLKRSLRAMGAATEADLRMYLTFPRTAFGVRRRALLEAVSRGEVIEIEAAGEARGKAARWFALAEDLPALQRAARRRAPSIGTTLLSPFDSVLWHRDRVRRLFGVDYTIEVYVPAPKRRHGYYSLPILHDGHVIGRLDPKTHREARRLELKNVHFEPWFATGAASPGAVRGRVERDAGLAGLSAAIRSLAVFVRADSVTLGRVYPRTLRAPLARALAAAKD